MPDAHSIDWEADASQAFFRDLPAINLESSRSRRWVMYHGATRIAFGSSKNELYRLAQKKHIPIDEAFIYYITPKAPSAEVDEVPDV